MKTAFFYFIAIFLITSCKKSDVPPNNPGPPNPPPTIKPALINSTYIPGNLEKGIKDTFLLQFNKAIQLRHIKFKRDYCLPDLQYSIVNNGTTVRFYNFLCGRLGGEYPFEFSVSDSIGNTLTDSITFNCYSRIISTPGDPLNYFLTPDNKYCWLITQAPNQVICFGISDTTYKKAFNLNFIPRKIVYNPFNSKLYILPSVDDLAHRKYIFVMNPETGIIEKSIYLYPDALNHPQHLDLFAYDIAFGTNGYGIVLIYDDVFSTRWKIINSQLNDSIYIHPSFPAYGNGNTRFASFKSAQLNFDGTKIFCLESYGNCRAGVLDCISQSLIELEHSLSPSFYSNYITLNKVKNHIFWGNVPQGQFITSNGIPIGTVTFFDGLNDAEADFSYRTDENNYIYYLDGNLIGIVNYTNGDILMTINFAYDLHRISSSTDGKYIFSIGNKCVKIFNTGLFYLHI